MSLTVFRSPRLLREVLVLSAALNRIWLAWAIILVLNSAWRLLLLRIIVMMYMREPRVRFPYSLAAAAGLPFCVRVATLYSSVPGPVLDYADQGAANSAQWSGPTYRQLYRARTVDIPCYSKHDRICDEVVNHASGSVFT